MQQAVNEKENNTSDEVEQIDVGTNGKSLQACNAHDNAHKKSVILKSELFLAEIQVADGKINYEKLQ